MNISVAIYQRRDGSVLEWTTLGLGPHTQYRRGQSAVKLQQSITDSLKQIVERMSPGDLEIFQMPLGIRNERLRLEISLEGAGKRQRQQIELGEAARGPDQLVDDGSIRRASDQLAQFATPQGLIYAALLAAFVAIPLLVNRRSA